MGLLKDLVKLWQGTQALIGPTFDVLEDIATGDFDLDSVDTLKDMLEEAMDLQDEVVEVARFQAMLAAAFVMVDLVGWIEAGGLQPVIDSRIGQAVATLTGPVATVWEKLKKEEQRLKGILDQAGIRQAVRTTQILHRLGLLVSPAYRERVARFFDSVRDLSEDVFGDTQTINSGLNLIQMSVYDISALKGESINLAETRYFSTSLAVTDRVANRSRQYSRNPGKFLYDLNSLFVRPLQDEKMIIERQRNGNLDRALTGLTQITETTDKVSERFEDYREHLNQFLEEDKLRELDDIRRNYEREVLQPLGKVDTFLTEIFPEVEDLVDATDATVTQMQEELSQVSKIVENPADLDEEGKVRQRVRINSILDNALELAGTPTERLQQAQDRVQSIFDALPE